MVSGEGTGGRGRGPGGGIRPERARAAEVAPAKERRRNINQIEGERSGGRRRRERALLERRSATRCRRRLGLVRQRSRGETWEGSSPSGTRGCRGSRSARPLLGRSWRPAGGLTRMTRGSSAVGSCGRESEREQRDVRHGKKKGGIERAGSRGRPGPRVADDEVARWRSARALLLAMRSRRRQGEVVDGLDWWLDRVDRGDASSAGWVRRGSGRIPRKTRQEEWRRWLDRGGSLENRFGSNGLGVDYICMGKVGSLDHPIKIRRMRINR